MLKKKLPNKHGFDFEIRSISDPMRCKIYSEHKLVQLRFSFQKEDLI